MAHPLGQQGANDPIGPALRIALPIVHCSADYSRPLVCGDRLEITLEPRLLDQGSFEVNYIFTCAGQAAAQGLTRHRAIKVSTRQACALPAVISSWLAASIPGDRPP